MSAQQDKGRPLPKFGEWDVNNPASAEGFTVIFSKARDEKKSNAAGGGGGGGGAGANSQRNHNVQKPHDHHNNHNNYQDPTARKWFCCF